MLGMLFSFQRSWFSFTCGGSVPTVITLAVTVAIVSEREPCLALGTNTKGCLSPLQFGRRFFSVGWCVAVPLLAADLSGAYWHIPGESKQVQAVLASIFLTGNLPQDLHLTCVFYQPFPQRFTGFVPPAKRENVFLSRTSIKWFSWPPMIPLHKTWPMFNSVVWSSPFEPKQ